MNKTTKVLGKIIGSSLPWGVITTGCVASILTMSAIVEPVQAADLKFDINYDGKRDDGSKDYDGQWVFDIDVGKNAKNEDVVTLKVVKANSDDNTKEFKGLLYTFPATKNDMGIYTFKGSDLGIPKKYDYDLTVEGTYDPKKMKVTFDKVQSINKDNRKDAYGYTFKQAVPEPLTLLGTGTALGFGAFFKRQLNLSKSTNKETTKVGI